MPTVRLRRFVSAHQRRFVLLLLATTAAALSLFMTVRACWSLSPNDSAFYVAALGALCEVSKLTFGPLALLGFVNATRTWECIGYLALAVLVLVLMAGSIGATFVFTTRIEAQALAAAEATRAKALAQSDEYRALTVDIETHATRVAAFMEDARALRAVNRPTAAAEKDKLLTAAQAEKDAAVARRSALHAAVPPSVDAPGEIVRWAHLALAVMVELIGVAACVLLHAGRTPAAHHAVSSSGSVSAVVPIGATRRRPRPARPRAAVPSSVGSDLADRCAKARSLIEAGQIDPSLDALARALRISQRPGQRLLKELCNEGVIQWAGNRYRLLWGMARAAAV